MTKLYNRQSEKENRKRLRRNQTFIEKTIWTHLRNSQVGGVKFRRQYSIDKFILDFYSPEIKLAVEIDGEVHDLPEQKIKDKYRQEFIESFGITVLRITNEEYTSNPDKAFGKIENEVKRLKNTSPRPSP